VFWAEAATARVRTNPNAAKLRTNQLDIPNLLSNEPTSLSWASDGSNVVATEKKEASRGGLNPDHPASLRSLATGASFNAIYVSTDYPSPITIYGLPTPLARIY
jgi:hypothetical protein